MRRLTYTKQKVDVTEAQREHAARLVLDHGMTQEQARKEVGLGSVQMVKYAVQGEKKRREALLVVEPDTFSKSVREKFDATLRQHKRNLEAAFSETVQKEVARRMEKILLPHWHKKIREAEDVVRSRRGIMSRADFRKVLAALHPDFPGDKSEAFQIVNDLELVLCSEKEVPTQSTGLPRTVQEMMAMRKGRKRTLV